MPHTTAMVFVLSGRLNPDADICIRYCLAHGYHVAGVVRDDWYTVCGYLYRGEADVVVVADAHSLDPERAPRVEVVAHETTTPERPDVPTGRPPGKHRRNSRFGGAGRTGDRFRAFPLWHPGGAGRTRQLR